MGPNGDGPRRVACILRNATGLQMWERAEFERQMFGLAEAGRDVWDEWDEAGEAYPDAEDGRGGPWGVSAIHQRLYGPSEERVYYLALTTVMCAAAVLPAAAAIPLMHLYPRGVKDSYR